jgi:hypothetical protein
VSIILKFLYNLILAFSNDVDSINDYSFIRDIAQIGDKMQVAVLIALIGPIVSDRTMNKMIEYSERHLIKKKTTLIDEEIELEA